MLPRLARTLAWALVRTSRAHLRRRCDALVGKFSSNIDRLAYMLMAVRAGEARPVGAVKRDGRPPAPRICMPPYISLDQPWCADFGAEMLVRPLPAQGYASEEAAARVLGRSPAGIVVGGFQC